jgi:catechol 2,3-dioxygenase-like lactoylglutathione lyase family enzyme
MIDHLDHLVLTAVDAEATVDFYTRVMGMQLETFGAGRMAFRYGNQKINLHIRGQEFHRVDSAGAGGCPAERGPVADHRGADPANRCDGADSVGVRARS